VLDQVTQTVEDALDKIAADIANADHLSRIRFGRFR
jgi:hypothetical protein